MLFIISRQNLLTALKAINRISHFPPYYPEQYASKSPISDGSFWARRCINISAKGENISISSADSEEPVVCPAQIEEEGEVAILFRDLYHPLQTMQEAQLIVRQDVELLRILPGDLSMRVIPLFVKSDLYPYLGPLLYIAGRLGLSLPALSEQLSVSRPELAQKFGAFLSELASQLDLSPFTLAEAIDVPLSSLTDEFEIPRSVFSERVRVLLAAIEQELENQEVDEFFDDSIFFEERFPYAYGWHTRELGFPNFGAEVHPSDFTVDEINDLWEKSEDKRWHDELDGELQRIAKIQKRWFGSEKGETAEGFYRNELSEAVGALFAKLSHLSGHPLLELADRFGIPRSVLAAQFKKEFEGKTPFPNVSKLFRPEVFWWRGSNEKGEEDEISCYGNSGLF